MNAWAFVAGFAAWGSALVVLMPYPPEHRRDDGPVLFFFIILSAVCVGLLVGAAFA